MNRLHRCCLGNVSRKLKRLYTKGKHKVQGELDVDKILNNLRELKVVMKASIPNEKNRFKFANNPKNTICIDSDQHLGFSNKTSHKKVKNQRHALSSTLVKKDKNLVR